MPPLMLIGYGYTVDASLPLLNSGTVQNPTLIPAELCFILPDQVIKIKLDGRETTDMLNVACVPPAANAKMITQQGRVLFNYDQGGDTVVGPYSHSISGLG